MTDVLEKQARDMTFCMGCGEGKAVGLVVCWHCFKYREDITPFKYFPGSFADWIRRLVLNLKPGCPGAEQVTNRNESRQKGAVKFPLPK